MKYLFLILTTCLFITACAPKKPPLSPTQIVDGKSIVIPPEIDILPETDGE